MTTGWGWGRWCAQPAADLRNPGGSCPNSIASCGVVPAEGPAGVWHVLSWTEVAVPSSVKRGRALGAGGIISLTAGVNAMLTGLCHAQRPPCPPLTSATGTPSGGRHCRRTSWSRGTSLPRGSWSKFLRRSGKREKTRPSLQAEVPHSSHEVAVHTKRTFTRLLPGEY